MAPPRFSRVLLRVCASAVVAALPGLSMSALAQTTQPSPGHAIAVHTAGGSDQEAASAPADATSQAQTELEVTFWTADDLFQQGAFAEAAALFTKALELSHRSDVSHTWRNFSPNIAFNVAHSHRRAGNCQAAQMAFAHYRGLVESVPEDHVAWHESLLAECPALQKKDIITTQAAQQGNQTPPDPSAIGTNPNQPAPAGNWLLDVNTKPTATSDIGATDMGRVVGWSAAGAAVVSLGLAGAFWVSADHQQDLAEGKRLWAEAESHQSAANTRRVVAGVLTGVGVALGGASVYLLTRPSSAASSGQTAVAALALRCDGTNISFWGLF